MKIQPDVVFVDHDTLTRIADQQAVDAYLRELNEDKIAPLERVLFAPRLSRQLRVLVSKLLPLEQELLQYRFWEGLTHKEISQEMGLSEEKVCTLIDHLLNDLQLSLFQILSAKKNAGRAQHV